MKARINYKSKKTIIIIAIAVVLLIAAITGTVAFIKGNNNAAAAMENTEITEPANNGNDSNNNGGVENPNTPNTDNPEQIPIIDDNQNPTTPAQNGNTTTNPGTTANQGTTTGTTTGNAGTTVPDTEYTQTTVVENPWKTEDITWAPISLQAKTETAGLNINTPDLEVTKTAYVGNQEITAEPTNTVVQYGQEITYVIRIKNTGNLSTPTIRTIDAIPEGTELVEETISEGGELVNGKITWKNVISAGETVELSFKVKVISEKEITLISNTAKVNGEDTPTTETPVVTTAKEAYLVVDGEFAKATSAKVGDTLKYVITITNNSNVPGKTTVTDTIPDGTTFVEKSINVNDKNTNYIAENLKDGIKVEVPANGMATVSFDVVINKETASKEDVKKVANVAVVGEKETPPVITPVANITTKKASTPSKTPLHELDTITYTLTATNSGNAEGTVILTDAIPEGTTLNSITGDGVESNGTITWNVVVPAKEGEVNGEAEVSFTVTIKSFKFGDENVIDENGKTIRKIYNLVATQDGTPIPGTTDEVEKEYVSVKVNKTWVDNDGEDGKRPSSVEFELYADGNSTGKKATTDAKWNAEFTQLDKYTEEGKLIKYSVKEIDVNEYYTDSYSTSNVVGNNTGITVTNTLKYEKIKISVEATKVWKDDGDKAGVRPDSVEFELYADSVQTNNIQKVNKVENRDEWKTTFEDVNKYTANGTKIKYSVQEVETPKYYTKNEEDLTVTNTIVYTSILTSKTATKVWDDNNNENRPTEVTIGIYDGNEKVKTAKATSPKWEAIFEGLQKYTENGEEITYTFKEETVPDGYVATVNDNVITNALPRLEVTKTVKSINGVDATTVNNSAVKENDIIEYLITVKNTGSVTVKNIEVTESLDVYLDAGKPEETTTSVGTITELTAGNEQSFKVYYKVTAEDVKDVNKNLVNVATATGEYTDGNGNKKEVTDDGETSVIPEERNDLSIVKTQKVNDNDVTKDTKVVPGDVITYTITVKNTGNTVLNNVEVTDSMLTKPYFELTNEGGFNLENGKLTINTLELNETRIITAKYTVQESDMKEEESIIENVATAKADKVPEINDNVKVPTEAWYADISTIKASEGSASPLHELDTITYTLTATNSGTDDGTVKLADTVPTGTTLVKDSVRLEGVNTPYTEVQLNEGIEVHLNAGETKKLTFTVTINPFETETGTISIVNNTATQDGTPIPGTTDEVEKEYVSVTVNKTWDDNETQASRRPSQIRFELYDGNSTQPIKYYNMNTTNKDESYTFDRLSKYNSDGTTITYTVQEKEINTNDLKFYISEHSENTDNSGNKTYNFTNKFKKPTDTKKVTVTKIWEDNSDAAQKRPTSVTLQLNNEDVILTSENAVSNDGNTWSTEMTVDVYNDNGEEIEYTATESVVPQWYKKDEQGTTVTNTFKAPTDIKYNITLTKVWDDNDNKAEKRPTSVKFDLYKIDVNGKEVLVEENIELTGNLEAEQWTITKNVQKYDEKANEIKYFVKEETTGSIFYINTDTDTTDLTVTNQFKVPEDKAVISVKKVWNDNNNSAAKREAVTIRVTGNGESQDIVLTSENANATDGNVWEKNNVDTNLLKYDNLGNEIKYTFDEVNIPDGYIKTVNNNEITNSLPGIKVTKTVSKVQDIDAKEMNGITVKKDDVIEYEITVENIGTIPLNNLKVTDNLNVYLDKDHPETTTNVLAENETLNANETKTYTVYYKVTAEDAKLGSQLLTNTATANAKYTDSNNKEQTVEDKDDADVTIQDMPGIEIIKTQKVNGNDATDATKVQPGDEIEYTITVTNTGNTVLKEVTVTDSMSEKEGFKITNGSLNIGTLGIAPNNIATITAKYTVQESDMKEEESIIENKATVKTTSTEPKESKVDVTTIVWKADITLSKSGKLADGTDANKKEVEYGEKITYVLSAKNDGNATGTATIKDSTLKTLIDENKVKDVTKIIIKDYDDDGNARTVEKDYDEVISGVEVNVPAGKTATVEFTVTATAKPGDSISNGVEGGNTEVVTPVVKTIKTKSNTGNVVGANYVLIIDTSKSMDDKIDSSTTKISAAKEAIKDLAKFLFENDQETTSKLSIVQFNSDSKVVNVNDQIVFGASDYKNGNIDKLIGNISTSRGTNIQAGLEKAGDLLYNTSTGIHATGLTTNNKDVIILLSDGEPSKGERSAEGLGRIAKEQLNKKGDNITNDIYCIAFGNEISTATLQQISSGKVYSSTNKENLFESFKNIIYEAEEPVEKTLAQTTQIIYTGEKEIASDKAVTITYDGQEDSLEYVITQEGTTEDGVLTYTREDGKYLLKFNLTDELLDKNNIVITYYVK